MQAASKPLRPETLGVLGDVPFLAYLAQTPHIVPEGLRYKRASGVTDDGLPYVIEAACGFAIPEERRQRELLIGLNWSPALKHPFAELDDWLQDVPIHTWDPVVLLLHVACPRHDFTDRGKSTLALPVAMTADLAKAVTAVTKDWGRLKRQADRDRRVSARALEHYQKMQRRETPTLKQAAYQVMERAYLHASGNGLYPANARQIMYAARPLVLALTGGKCWDDTDYFTQTLLPDFIETHPELTAGWNVAFDPRGHFVEPHTGRRIGIGTLEVRAYRAEWGVDLASDLAAEAGPSGIPTCGPQHRFGAVLFIEKEGFDPLLARAQIAARYDLALMSTKGMSVTAARQLVEHLCQLGVPILVLHDFDKSGFSILQTLRADTRRYRYATPPEVMDLGLRLGDVRAMLLPEEQVTYQGKVDPKANLRASGATEEECQFLVRRYVAGQWVGARVELNAMTAPQFITWLEAKLHAVGVQKVVPPDEALATAYRRLVLVNRLQQAIEAAWTALPAATTIPVPPHLRQQIQARIAQTDQAWDMALWTFIQEQRQQVSNPTRSGQC